MTRKKVNIFIAHEFFGKLHGGEARKKEYRENIKKFIVNHNKNRKLKLEILYGDIDKTTKKKREIWEIIFPKIKRSKIAIFDLSSAYGPYGYNLNVILELGLAMPASLKKTKKRKKTKLNIFYVYNWKIKEPKDVTVERIKDDISDLSIWTEKKLPTGKIYLYKDYADYRNVLKDIFARAIRN